MNGPPRIVLIDDDPAWLESLAELFREEGYPVDTADDGAGGLSLFDKQDVALVVIDYHLAGADGLEVLREVRRRRPGVAALLASADEEPSLPARALAAGARAFVPKTASPGMIRRLVREAVGGGNQPDRPAERQLLPVPARVHALAASVLISRAAG